MIEIFLNFTSDTAIDVFDSFVSPTSLPLTKIWYFSLIKNENDRNLVCVIGFQRISTKKSLPK